eukprot:12916658-Prorocentrum_lima.AAC.1
MQFVKLSRQSIAKCSAVSLDGPQSTILLVALISAARIVKFRKILHITRVGAKLLFRRDSSMLTCCQEVRAYT